METTQKPKEIIGHLMVLSTIVIYSFNTNFMKILMPEWIGPHGLVLIRCTVMAFGFWIISLFIPANKQQAKPKRKDILMMMLGGLLGIGGNLLLYINGLNITGPVDAFVIRTVQPIIVIALAVLILHADFNRYKAIGIILGLAGTLYVSITPHTGVVKDSFTDLRCLGFQRTLSHINQTLHPEIQFDYSDALDELGSLYPRTSFRLASSPQSPAIHVRGPRTYLVGTRLRAYFSHDDSLFPKLESPAIHFALRGKRVYLPPPHHRSHRVNIARPPEILMARPDRPGINHCRIRIDKQKEKSESCYKQILKSNYKNTFILSDKSAIIPLCFFRNSHIFILDSGFCNISGDSSIKVTTFSNSFVSLTLVANICMKNTLLSLSSNRISISFRNSSPLIFANLSSLIIVLSF